MPFKNIFLLFFLAFCPGLHAQQIELSPLSKISVLTSGSGDILYTAFGHSAIRVKDMTLGIDVVYNYGIFDTSGENFYYKFSQGRMDYKVERQRFENYIAGYKIENRWVKEQVLNLSLKDKNAVFHYLEKNNLPENKVYPYDYFSNNCATKIWDVLAASLGEELVFDETYIDKLFTFRELVHHNIKINSWGSFGIDLALGSDIDQVASAKQHMYLPIYILKQMKVARLNGKIIAAEPVTLFETTPERRKSSFLTSPLTITIVLAIIILSITYVDYDKNKRTAGLDFCIFLTTGLAGLVIFYLWFLTDHIWTVNNYNILWAFPLSAFISVFMLRKKPAQWISVYILTLIALFALLTIFWIFKVQFFTPVLLPLLIAMIIRYIYIWRYFRSLKTI